MAILDAMEDCDVINANAMADKITAIPKATTSAYARLFLRLKPLHPFFAALTANSSELVRRHLSGALGKVQLTNPLDFLHADQPVGRLS